MSVKLLSTLLATSFGLPEQASTVAPSVDRVYLIILGLSTFFFVAIIATLIYFLIKYRRKDPNQRTSPIHENLVLEITWIIIPSVLLVWIFLEGFWAWVPMNYAPADAIEVRVTAQQWKWLFDYPKANVKNAPELVVPVGKPVKLIMSSVDVIHSFFVPAFRLKRDVLPNRYTTLWFQATKKGVYNMLCTEYCGKDHSTMVTRVRVVDQADFDKWVKKKQDEGANGKLLYANLGCNTCHSIDGSKKAGGGPSFKNLFGKMEKVKEGGVVKTIKVDENYIRTSIVNPNQHIVVGYPPLMPTFKGRITTSEINALTDYIKELSGAKKKKK